METQLDAQLSVYEQNLLKIVRVLPVQRVQELLDFAEFLKMRSTSNDQWDTLLETDEAQNLLDKLADEALADIQAGRTNPMIFTDAGEIAPG